MDYEFCNGSKFFKNVGLPTNLSGFIWMVISKTLNLFLFCPRSVIPADHLICDIKIRVSIGDAAGGEIKNQGISFFFGQAGNNGHHFYSDLIDQAELELLKFFGIVLFFPQAVGFEIFQFKKKLLFGIQGQDQLLGFELVLNRENLIIQ